MSHVRAMEKRAAVLQDKLRLLVTSERDVGAAAIATFVHSVRRPASVEDDALERLTLLAPTQLGYNHHGGASGGDGATAIPLSLMPPSISSTLARIGTGGAATMAGSSGGGGGGYSRLPGMRRDVLRPTERLQLEEVQQRRALSDTAFEAAFALAELFASLTKSVPIMDGTYNHRYKGNVNPAATRIPTTSAVLTGKTSQSIFDARAAAVAAASAVALTDELMYGSLQQQQQQYQQPSPFWDGQVSQQRDLRAAPTTPSMSVASRPLPLWTASTHGRY
jgi:hypothetical protein